MTDIKLGRLPDRTPIKLTIAVTPDLNEALGRYADAYQAKYGQAEQVADLVPYMLRAFIESDRGFARSKP